MLVERETIAGRRAAAGRALAVVAAVITLLLVAAGPHVVIMDANFGQGPF